MPRSCCGAIRAKAGAAIESAKPLLALLDFVPLDLASVGPELFDRAAVVSTLPNLAALVLPPEALRDATAGAALVGARFLAGGGEGGGGSGDAIS